MGLIFLLFKKGEKNKHEISVYAREFFSKSTCICYYISKYALLATSKLFNLSVINVG